MKQVAQAQNVAGRLAALLEEFGAAPGNFPVRLREPRELYEELDTIAGWALGKVPAELAGRTLALQVAAVLFVQRACFAAGNSHYEVLGVAQDSISPDMLRSRYRALIRLTHPDVGVAGLPSDAAGTVNRAYEVLADPELRAIYDESLKHRGAASGRDVSAPSLKRIELRATWGEKWQLWSARYPTLMRAGLTVGAVGLVGLALVIWATASLQSGSSMIVARSGTTDQPIEKSDSERAQVRVPKIGNGSPSSPAVAGSISPMDVRAGSAMAKQGQESAAQLALKAYDGQSRIGSNTAASAVSSVTTASGSTPPSTQVQAPTTSSTVKHLGNLFGWSDSRISEGDAPSQTIGPTGTASNGAHNQTSTNTAGSPALATSTRVNAQASTQTTNIGVGSANISIAKNPSAVGGASPSPSSAYPVDTVRAKSYLTDIIMTLERAPNARSTNSYLSEMNVQGSLLQPALQLMRKYPDINVENFSWQDSIRPGVMKVQGIVTLTARNSSMAESRKVAFQLNAEFWGMRDGTFLAALNLKEED